MDSQTDWFYAGSAVRILFILLFTMVAVPVHALDISLSAKTALQGETIFVTYKLHAENSVRKGLLGFTGEFPAGLLVGGIVKNNCGGRLDVFASRVIFIREIEPHPSCELQLEITAESFGEKTVGTRGYGAWSQIQHETVVSVRPAPRIQVQHDTKLYPGDSIQLTGLVKGRCLNFYLFSSQDRLSSCCSCSLYSMGDGDLTSATLTFNPGQIRHAKARQGPAEMDLKIVATQPAGQLGCFSSAKQIGTTPPAPTVTTQISVIRSSGESFTIPVKPIGAQEAQSLAEGCTAVDDFAAAPFRLCLACRSASIGFH